MKNTKKLAQLGMICGILGGLLVALNIAQTVGFIGYVLFTVSSIAWIIYANKTKQLELLTLNTVFLVINLVGVVRWF